MMKGIPNFYPRGSGIVVTGRFEYTAASFTQEELVAFNDALEAKFREGKSAEEIIKAIQEI